MGYPIGVPISAPLKEHRPEQISVKELNTDIRRGSAKKLPKCAKNYEFRGMKANFAEGKHCDFCFLEHAVFLNEGFISIFQGFSANFFQNIWTPFKG